MDNIQEIKSRLDVVDVISGYIRLTPAGPSNFKALCPFHNEKTPSFMVSRERQIWKCFGCNKGGSIFDFVMEMEGVEFKDALRILAGKAGIELKKQDPKVTGHRNQILDCLDAASRFFYQVLLKTDEAAFAREYLEKRCVQEETIDEFRLGFAPESWDLMFKALVKKGFQPKEIEQAGLIVKRQQGNGYYDRFRNRLMFPIRDINGNAVGFSGRILGGHTPSPQSSQSSDGTMFDGARQDGKNAETSFPSGGSLPAQARGVLKNENLPSHEPAKYINTPQTIVFDKSKVIYALEKAKLEIKKKDLAIIVEGQMDVVASHQAGIKNVIACSGTSLTPEHIRIIKRYTNNVALSFDTDEAGKAAARRAVDIALRAEMNIKIIAVPGGKDPDECIKNNPNDWKQAIENASPFLEYYFQQIFLKVDLTKAEGKKEAVKKLLPLIKNMSDRIEQTHYLQKLARNVNIPENLLREILISKFFPKPPRTGVDAKPNVEVKKNKIITLAERILSLGLIFFEHFGYIINHLSPEILEKTGLKNLYNQLIIYYTRVEQEDFQREKSIFDFKFFKALCETNNLAENIREDCLSYLDELWLLGKKESSDFEIQGENLSSQKAKLEIETCLSALKKKYYKNRLDVLRINIQKAENADDMREVEKLSKEANELNRELRE